MIGCGQGGDITAVGITGGSDDGYGRRTDISGTTNDDNENQVNQNLVGTWRADYDAGAYQILIFYADGRYETSFYMNNQIQDIYYGSYTSTSNSIRFDGSDTASYTIVGNILTIDFGDYSLSYYRV
jgi:hypothetical protein